MDKTIAENSKEQIKVQYRVNKDLVDKNTISVLIRDANDNLVQLKSVLEILEKKNEPQEDTNKSTFLTDNLASPTSWLNSKSTDGSDVRGRPGLKFPWQRK